ncbi:MAG: TIGR03905 family TSCPD domain-containing protein [Lachnospiraceae bacterium]
MFHYDYKTVGTCSKVIHLDLDGEIVRNVSFEGGCNGNLKAIGILVEGQTVDFVIEKLAGNICGMRNTSCADQLSKAVRAARIAQSEQ